MARETLYLNFNIVPGLIKSNKKTNRDDNTILRESEISLDDRRH